VVALFQTCWYGATDKRPLGIVISIGEFLTRKSLLIEPQIWASDSPLPLRVRGIFAAVRFPVPQALPHSSAYFEDSLSQTGVGQGRFSFRLFFLVIWGFSL